MFKNNKKYRKNVERSKRMNFLVPHVNVQVTQEKLSRKEREERFTTFTSSEASLKVNEFGE